MIKYALLLLITILTGCQTAKIEFQEHTLAGNPRLPVERIKVFFEGKSDWEAIKNEPYDAYAILRGTVQRDRTVEIHKVLESYPEVDWAYKAQLIAKHVRLSATRVGSRVPPGAEVYVIFYNSETSSPKALLFAKQLGIPAGSADFGKTQYMTIYWY